MCEFVCRGLRALHSRVFRLDLQALADKNVQFCTQATAETAEMLGVTAGQVVFGQGTTLHNHVTRTADKSRSASKRDLGKENVPIWCGETTLVKREFVGGSSSESYKTVGDVNKGTLMGGWQHFDPVVHQMRATDVLPVCIPWVSPVFYAGDRDDDGTLCIPAPEPPDDTDLGVLFRWVITMGLASVLSEPRFVCLTCVILFELTVWH